MRSRKRVSIGVAALVGLAAACCVGCGSSKEDGWTRHDDPSGFVVELPPGWSVETPDDKPILIHNADRSAFVVIQPFIALKTETARDVLQGVGNALSSVFPDATVTDVQGVAEEGDTTPAEATAVMPFRLKGVTMMANTECSMYKRSAMFYAIAAPQDRFGDMRDTMVRILASLSFEKPAAQPPRPVQEWTTWRDPNEGAFSLEVPKDWNVRGGTTRMAAVDVRPSVEATSPDGKTTVFGGDAALGAFCTPNALLEQAGIREGDDYSPGYGVHMTVARYLSGAAFAARYAERGLGNRVSGVRISDKKARPEVADKLKETLASFGGGLDVGMDTGEVRFTCSAGGEPREGYCFAGTLSAGRTWSIPFLYGYTAPPGMGDEAEGLLKHMVDTYRLDEQWEARQQGTTMQVSKIVTQTNHEIMDIWESAQSTGSSRGRPIGEDPHDAAMRRWSNYMRGQETVYDPDSGETWQVESGHNYYYARPTATSPEFAGNESGSLPDYRYHEVVVVH